MSEQPIKSLGLSPALHAYLVDHGTPPDEILCELAQRTRERIGRLSIMQIAPEQGALLTMLARLIGARRAIEIGTFTGYSAICIARGLADGGELLCCDVSQEWTDIGRPFWKRAGVENKIELRLAPALETLRACRPTAASTWPSSTRSRPSTGTTSRRSTACCAPAAWSSSTTCSGRATWSTRRAGARHPGDPRLQRPGRAGRPRRSRDAPGGGWPDAAAHALGRTCVRSRAPPAPLRNPPGVRPRRGLRRRRAASRGASASVRATRRPTPGRTEIAQDRMSEMRDRRADLVEEARLEGDLDEGRLREDTNRRDVHAAAPTGFPDRDARGVMARDRQRQLDGSRALDAPRHDREVALLDAVIAEGAAQPLPASST